MLEQPGKTLTSAQLRTIVSNHEEFLWIAVAVLAKYADG
jgi:hypothetical protein